MGRGRLVGGAGESIWRWRDMGRGGKLEWRGLGWESQEAEEEGMWKAYFVCPERLQNYRPRMGEFLVTNKKSAINLYPS